MYAGIPVRYIKDMHRYKLNDQQLNNLNQINITLPSSQVYRCKGIVSVTTKSGKYFKLKEVDSYIHKQLSKNPKIWDPDALVSYVFPSQCLNKLREPELFIQQAYPLIYKYVTLYLKLKNESGTN